MNVVSDEHKATLRQWHEELQEKRGLRASLRRSATLNDVCLSEGFHSLMVQTHSLWNTRGEGVAFLPRWRWWRRWRRRSKRLMTARRSPLSWGRKRAIPR